MWSLQVRWFQSYYRFWLFFSFSFLSHSSLSFSLYHCRSWGMLCSKNHVKTLCKRLHIKLNMNMHKVLVEIMMNGTESLISEPNSMHQINIYSGRRTKKLCIAYSVHHKKMPQKKTCYKWKTKKNTRLHIERGGGTKK